MFISEYQHTLDTKSRIIVPIKFREELGDKFVMTKGLDHCIFVYPLSEWNSFQEKLKTLPLTNQNARMFVRFFLSGAVECELDKQGRVLISPNLRDYADLDKEVVSIGVGTRVEIWSKRNWEDYHSMENMNLEELAHNMAELGI